MSPCAKDPLVQSSGVLVGPVPASRFREVSAALLCFNDLYRVQYFVPCIQNANASIARYVFPSYPKSPFDILIELISCVLQLIFHDLFCLVFMDIVCNVIFTICDLLGCVPSFLSISTNPPLSSLQRPESVSNKINQSIHGPMHSHPRGGGGRYEFHFDVIEQHLVSGSDIMKDNVFIFVDHVDSTGQLSYPADKCFVHASIPLEKIVPFLPVKMLLKIAKLHHISIGSHAPKSEIIHSFDNHSCASCNLYHSVFTVVESRALKAKKKIVCEPTDSI